jgi:hypothetical protein
LDTAVVSLNKVEVDDDCDKTEKLKIQSTKMMKIKIFLTKQQKYKNIFFSEIQNTFEK